MKNGFRAIVNPKVEAASQPARVLVRVAAADPAAQEESAPRAARLPRPDDIARRAFELFMARGGQHGSHEDDWYRAERELSGCC